MTLQQLFRNTFLMFLMMFETLLVVIFKGQNQAKNIINKLAKLGNGLKPN